jgi:hypothetical protein
MLGVLWESVMSVSVSVSIMRDETGGAGWVELVAEDVVKLRHTPSPPS